MAKDIATSDVLELSQEEKQIIWDALYHYQYELCKLSQSNHFAKDVFAKEYRTCVNLMAQIDKKWKIKH